MTQYDTLQSLQKISENVSHFKTQKPFSEITNTLLVVLVHSWTWPRVSFPQVKRLAQRGGIRCPGIAKRFKDGI